VKRPRLSASQLMRVKRLRTERGLTFAAIAERIGRPEATIVSVCHRKGWDAPALIAFSAAEDEAIVALDLAGLTPAQIGRVLPAPRKGRSVAARLDALQSREFGANSESGAGEVTSESGRGGFMIHAGGPQPLTPSQPEADVPGDCQEAQAA